MGPIHLVERWAAGDDVDRKIALAATYAWGRRVRAQWVVVVAVWAASLLVVVGAITGANGSRIVQYGILGAAVGTAVALIGVHSLVEAALRPPRLAIAGDTEIGDSMPPGNTFWLPLNEASGWMSPPKSRRNFHLQFFEIMLGSVAAGVLFARTQQPERNQP
jgi:hypothetical protein